MVLLDDQQAHGSSAPVGTSKPGAQHGQSSEARFMHTADLKVACPATPYDAKGTLIVAIRDDNPARHRCSSRGINPPRHPAVDHGSRHAMGGSSALEDVTVIWVEASADRRFLTTYSVHFEKGLAECIFEVAETKRALIASAREITGQ
jgi:hypothetical protein